MLVEVSTGEVFDKISILRIKKSLICDPIKLANITDELNMLEAAASIPKDYQHYLFELIAVNSDLWYIEDDLRYMEEANNFGEEFIRAARQVYKLNDQRAGIKRTINIVSGSKTIEEKSYKQYKEQDMKNNHTANKAGVESGLSEYSHFETDPNKAGLGRTGDDQKPSEKKGTSVKKFGKSFKIA